MYTRRSTSAAALAAAALLLGSAAPAAAQTDLEKLSIHGYLTQGIARSSDLPIFGISDQTTADYRNAALQFRYAMTTKDNVVLQFSHRRLGGSILTAATPDVGVDWAFYQRRAGAASVRVGRAPLPAGIYNEIRDVGTLLPFYRAPGTFYREGVETIDGVVGTVTRDVGDWSLEGNAYFGGMGFQVPMATEAGPVLLDNRIEGNLGYQLWLATPVQGLRIGTGGRFWEGTEALFADGERQYELQASMDGSFDRTMVRAEFARLDLHTLFLDSWYVQGGVKATERLGLYAQYEASSTTYTQPVRQPTQRSMQDLAGVLNFAVNPSLVLKLEAHRATGRSFDTFIAPTAPAGRTTYGIVSVSTSF